MAGFFNLEKQGSLSMGQIDDYCDRYVEQWDASANVRRKDRYLAASGSRCADMINPGLIPYLDHPFVQSLGSDARDFLSVQKCYDMLVLLADHETEMVARVCLDLVDSAWHAVRPRAVRKALLSVAVDESYHSLVAEEDIEQLERVSGIALFPSAQDHEGVEAAATALLAAQGCCDEETLPALNLLVIALMENATTDELADMVRFGDQDCPFLQINQQHLRDEARHRLLFRQLMRSAWAGLDEGKRRVVSEALPIALEGYMTSMMRLDQKIHAARLCHLGLSAEEAEEVLEQVPGVPPMDVNPLWWNMWTCIAEIGLEEDPHFKRVFGTG